MLKRIIAVFLAFVTIFLMVPFASADYTDTAIGYWDSLLHGAVKFGNDIPLVGPLIQCSFGELGTSVCSQSEDGFHHTPSLKGCAVSGDENGVYAVAKCQFCGREFKAYSSEIGAAYDEAVSTLPSNGYSSDNSILWYPSWKDIYYEEFEESGGVISEKVSIASWKNGLACYFVKGGRSATDGALIYTAGSDDRSINVRLGDVASVSLSYLTSGLHNFTAPIDGTYFLQDGTAYVCSYILYSSSGAARTGGKYVAKTNGSHVLTGGVVAVSSLKVKFGKRCSAVSGTMYFPVFRVVPDVVPDDVPTVYSPSTRPNITNIFNETTNVYTNPTTGEQKTVNNWNYNYTTRTYDLSLLDGMTVKLEFGDINIKLGETSVNDSGDTITNNYTYNYTINNNNPSPSPSPSKSPSPTTPPSVSVLSRVFQNYGHKITQHYGNEGHNGVDVIPTSGMADTVIAHSEGTVVTVQTGQENDTSATGAASWGNYVKIEHPNGMYTLYAHLARVDVEEGETVYKGQPLGLMGNTGRSFGAHLHFEVYEAETTRINPEPYLNADLPGLETSSDGWTWWKGAWTDFRQWFSGAIGGGKTETIFTPGVDSGGEGEEDDEWSFLDLLKAVVDGVWKFIKGVPGAIFGGLMGLVDGLGSVGDFFDSFDRNNPDGVFNVLTYGGDDLWD